MKDKHIKIWLVVFALTLMSSGALASYLAEQNTYYKGDQRADAAFLTEVLPHNKMSAQVVDAEKIIKENEDRIEKLTQTNVLASDEIHKEPDTQVQKTPTCAEGSVPLIKDAKIIGCSGEKNNEAPAQEISVPISVSLAPAPKVKILLSEPAQTVSQPTCEEQGKIRYTGQDRPGLLYGMCIDKN